MFHPDLYANESEEVKIRMTRIMQEINEAYTTLSKLYYEGQFGDQTDDEESSKPSESMQKTRGHVYQQKSNKENNKHQTRNIYINMIKNIYELDIFTILINYMKQVYNDMDIELIKEYYIIYEDKFINNIEKENKTGATLRYR